MHRTAATALVAAPVLMSLSHFLWPAGAEGGRDQQFTAAAAHPVAWVAAGAVEALGWLALVPALVVLVRLVTGRGRVPTRIGAAVTAVGVLGHLAGAVLNAAAVPLAQRPDRAAALAAYDGLTGDTATVLAVVLPILLAGPGLAVLAVGLVRAGWIGWWAPAAVLVTAVATELLAESADPLLLTAALLPLAAVLVAVARRLAGEPSARQLAGRDARRGAVGSAAGDAAVALVSDRSVPDP
jgi:hypothetical protein